MREAPPFEEAPVARAGPRSPDAFYRGEEAGAAIKLTEIMDEAKQKTARKHLLLLTVGIIGFLVLVSLISLMTTGN